jgi:hypothetical protein
MTSVFRKMIDTRTSDGGEINDTRMLELQRSSDDNDELVDEVPSANDQMLTVYTPMSDEELDELEEQIRISCAFEDKYGYSDHEPW